jgi:hypothetical protein
MINIHTRVAACETDNYCFFLFIFEEQKITCKATNDTRDEKENDSLVKKKEKKKKSKQNMYVRVIINM